MKKILILAALGVFLAAGCQKQDRTAVPPVNNTNQQGSQATTSPVLEQTYQSPQNGFYVKYGADFGFQTDYAKVQALGYLPVCDENMAACIFYTGNNYKGTNFEAAGVSINILKTLNTQAECYNFKVATNSAQTAAADITINGVVFKTATGGDAGLGHYGEVTAYRNFHNNKCYEIQMHINSTNIGNYEPGTIKEFDRPQVQNLLLQIANSFKFVDQAATEPLQGQVALSGTTVCLPHKNVKPGDPQTMECAIGLKDETSGKFYGLNNVPGGFYETNVKVKVVGMIMQDPGSNYDVAGNIQVTSLVKSIDK